MASGKSVVPPSSASRNPRKLGQAVQEDCFIVLPCIYCNHTTKLSGCKCWDL